MLELRSPDGAFEQIEAYLRERGFFAPGGEELRGRPLPRLRALGAAAPARVAAPARAVPAAAAAVRVREREEILSQDTVPRTCPIGSWERTWADAEYAAAVEAVREAIGRGDVYQVNLVQHLSADFGGDPAALAARLAAFGPRTLAGDGWAIVSASPELFLARRGPPRVDQPDQGHAPAR